MNTVHRHVADPAISVPHISTCRCGAILVLGRTEWLEPTGWEPPPWEPPTPQVRLTPARSTTPLPLLLEGPLREACRE